MDAKNVVKDIIPTPKESAYTFHLYVYQMDMEVVLGLTSFPTNIQTTAITEPNSIPVTMDASQ